MDEEAASADSPANGPGQTLVLTADAVRRRRRALRLLALCVVVLVPWTVYLALFLPDQFQARHWSAAWVGFDVMLLVSLTGAGLAVFLRRQILILLAVIAGTLLVCDAWFDIALDWGTSQVWGSVASAVLVELPLAALLFLRARRLQTLTVRLAWQRLGLPGEPPPLHRQPLLSAFAPPSPDASPPRPESPTP
ncbi:hypothetical protein ABIA33_006990 [Streptacidiphilus sp. MAP12-16]|uniref:hypothetical protein n=1 Tax=Streptacidiphilus sp. MAP12-16 TaxID=3156300 RepID=UPI0035193E0C